MSRGVRDGCHKFKCYRCLNSSYLFGRAAEGGKVCIQCHLIGLILSPPIVVYRALGLLWKIERSAYRVIEEGRPGDLRRIALKMKARALVGHDRLLRAAR